VRFVLLFTTQTEFYEAKDWTLLSATCSRFALTKLDHAGHWLTIVAAHQLRRIC
jgi:hypothetical protein